MDSADTKNRIRDLETLLAAERAEELFCVFYSPGTFFPETNSVEVASQEDLVGPCARAREIVQRHGAKPYGFVFQDGNGKLLSGMHYLGGKLIMYDDLPYDDEYNIMRSNMRDSPVAIENTNSYRFTGQFFDSSILLDPDTGQVIRRGDDADLVAYREEVRARFS